MNLKNVIACARGDMPSDILFTNTRIVNVFSGEIVPGSIAVYNGAIVGIGEYPAKAVLNMNGMFAAPGFIDAHVHIESALTGISQFARAVIPHGTTTVVADPHEIANVLGIPGIQYMLDSSENQPMNIYFTMSSCVPATVMETSGASLGPDDIRSMLNHDRIVGLAEMMNYPGVIFRDGTVLSKIEAAHQLHKRVDGHAPGLTGPDLNAYLSAGITSDHECTTLAEATEKLRSGMHIMIREGSGAKNLDTLLPLVSPLTAHRLMWCTDDRNPHHLIGEGHIDSMIRRAIQSGLDPIIAIQMATLHPAGYFGLHHLGAIAPGRQADLVFFSDLEHLFAEVVYCRGVAVAQNGKMDAAITPPMELTVPSSMNVRMDSLDFSIPAEGETIRIIEIVPDQIMTGSRMERARIDQGNVVSDISRDILKLAVVERHHQTGNIGKGFVRGFHLKQGAIATSIAHDSHNIIVVGVSDADMRIAVDSVIQMGGGIAVVKDGSSVEKLPLPIGGLMSTEPLEQVETCLNRLIAASRTLGCLLGDPFMTLSFLALPVIPELKLTDKGLVNVLEFKPVSLFPSAL
ncbi:MAG: adenine deaminase [Desulfatirhabdiaceae bacterium]